MKDTSKFLEGKPVARDCTQICLWAVLILLGSSPGYADGTAWEVSPGAGGISARGGWSYVVVRITSGPDTLRGEVVVQCPGQVNGVYHLPIEQPPKTTRRYALYFQTETNDCEVSLLVKRRPVGKPKPVRLASEFPTSCILEIGRGTQIDLAFRSMFLRRSPYARSDWELLPGNPAGYDNTEWLIVSDSEKAGELSYGKARALRVWVETGGKLMVFLRPGQQPAGVIRDLLDQADLSASGMVRVRELKALSGRFSLPEERESFAATAISAPAGARRWVEQGVVLSAVAPVGWGRIGLCGVHPSLVKDLPVADPEFWDYVGGIELTIHRLLIGGAGAGFAVAKQTRLVDECGDLLIPGEVALPLSMGGVIVYLLAYLGVIGPLQGWMLRKKASFKMSLSVLVLSVLAFAALANSLVKWKKGKEVWQKDLGILTISETGASRGLMFSSLFVPASGDLRMSLGPEVLACPMYSGARSWLAKEGQRDWNLWLMGRGTEASMNFRKWDVRSFIAMDWHHPSALTGVSPLPKGLSPGLRRAYLISGKGVRSLGDISFEDVPDLPAAGRWRTIEQVTGPLVRSRARGEDHSKKQIEEVLLALCMGRPNSVRELDVLPMVKQGSAVLIGFVDYSPLVADLSQPVEKHLTVCLVRMLVSLDGAAPEPPREQEAPDQ